MKNKNTVLGVLAIMTLISLVSALSFDVGTSILNYTCIPPGGFCTKNVNLYLRAEETMACKIEVEGDIKDWISLNKTPVILTPYTQSEAQVDIRIPYNASEGVYTSKLYFTVVEYSTTGSQMGMSVGIRYPVDVHVTVLKNETLGVYEIKDATVIGADTNKNLIIREENSGDKILLLNYYIDITKDNKPVKTLMKEGNLRPYSSKDTQLSLETENLQPGEYNAELTVSTDDLDYATVGVKFQLGTTTTLIATETTTTTPTATTTTQPESKLPVIGLSLIAILIIGVIILVILLIIIAKILKKKNKKISEEKTPEEIKPEEKTPE